MDIAGLRNRPFWILHGVWALLWIGVSIYFLSIPKSGDMPASLMIIFTIPAGFLGHGLILLISFFKRLGDRQVARQTGERAPKWPWLIILVSLILIVTTYKSGSRFFWLDIGYYLGSPEQLLQLGEMLVVLLFKLACLVGLLLRKVWAKWFIIGLLSYWIVEAAYMAYVYSKTYPGFQITIFFRPVAYAVGSVVLIILLLRARGVQRFFGRDLPAPAARQ